MVKLEKELPNSKDSESVVLGLSLIDNKQFNIISEYLNVGDFKNPFHRDVFVVMSELWEESKVLDPVLINNKLIALARSVEYGGLLAITGLMDGLPPMAEERVLEYIKIIKGKSKAREVINIASRIENAAMDDADDIDKIIDDAQVDFLNLNRDTAKSGLLPVQGIVDTLIEQARNAAESESSITGVPTGFAVIDQMTSGLQRQDLIIVAARPSMGKTAMGMAKASHAAIREGKNVAFFSLEMSREAVTLRMICAEAMVDSRDFKSGTLTKDEWARLAHAIGEISSSKLFIDDSAGVTPMEMRAKAKRMEAAVGQLDLIVVDYIQLMNGSKRSENRQQEVSSISRELKGLAKEMNCPVVALSQLSRSPEGRGDKRPLMSDLRESGAIEQDADVVAFLYRDEYYNPTPDNKGMAEFIIAKQRNGPTGTIDLGFIGKYTKFTNLIY